MAIPSRQTSQEHSNNHSSLRPRWGHLRLEGTSPPTRWGSGSWSPWCWGSWVSRNLNSSSRSGVGGPPSRLYSLVYWTRTRSVELSRNSRVSSSPLTSSRRSYHRSCPRSRVPLRISKRRIPRSHLPVCRKGHPNNNNNNKLSLSNNVKLALIVQRRYPTLRKAITSRHNRILTRTLSPRFPRTSKKCLEPGGRVRSHKRVVGCYLQQQAPNHLLNRP